MQNKINVGLIGAGTVGGGTYKILKENFSEISRKTGKEIIVFALAEKDIKKAKELNSKNIEGIIIGKAIYDGDIKLDELAKEVNA